MYGKKVVIACLCSSHGVISDRMQVLGLGEGSLQHDSLCEGVVADVWVLSKGSRAWPGLHYRQTIIVGDKQMGRKRRKRSKGGG